MAGPETGCKKEQSDLDERVKWVLLVGVASSVALMLIGLATYALNPDAVDTAISVSRMPSELVKGNPVALISIGILVLIATPVVRVIAVSATFVQKKDGQFALIGVLVLLILILSFVLATLKA